MFLTVGRKEGVANYISNGFLFVLSLYGGYSIGDIVCCWEEFFFQMVETLLTLIFVSCVKSLIDGMGDEMMFAIYIWLK